MFFLKGIVFCVEVFGKKLLKEKEKKKKIKNSSKELKYRRVNTC